ncbi:DUF2599 domain-containing protein [Erysipelothrix rhusiopathiae]|uniref:DUF2599 domain-containing protein n=1 Tax=Erysipelothrix rhusiopathiae TaxID=1648 RepID=UPI001EDFAA56|nr:DUF2599 domain-containing protein [Erysipelothrix rhusiopathiae]MCG4435915.1 DUF2599 domain-containing protein [Erysipelothrix rhusiopathiae]
MKKIKYLLISALIFSAFILPVSADESTDSSSDLDNFPDEIEVVDDIDWNSVTEIIILYDDGTTEPASENEANKREELKQENKITDFSVLSARSWTNYFSKVEWINYGGWTKSLSLTPKKDIGGTVAKKESAWRELRRIWLHDNHPIFREFNNPGKVDSMYYQYVCHVDYARGKPTYNLEPMRRNVGYWETVRAGCNPAWY